ncbi:allantoinase AllB [Nesterenkonia lutea]|uniref:allantoinase n=1 Tax=Nesterenkonia lutea TaxID=272919 RepID=A0ABR9JGT5_9MICC|nr:allantoinase AllB [Nesterenkonia lutea]MBE1524682.1 allantoinase [Nesterenkonia lutea]
MTLRHLIAEQVLLGGEFVPAHLEILDGEIARIHRLSTGEGRRREEIVKASDVGAGAGMTVVRPSHLVLPGNVDTHVHINEPGRTSWEGFATGTMAAALGGVTSVVDMPLNSIPPTVDVESLRIKQRAAMGQTYVDVGFWGGIIPGNTAQLRPLWEAGAFGFKCFLLPSGVDEFPPVNGEQLREAMAEVARFDGLVIVHAEDAETIERATEVTGRRRRLSHYADWALTRPHDAEVAAISDLIEAVRETGCRTHILHLASARALDIIAAARTEGLPLTVETCPHYLCFEADSIPDGAAEFKCCPPIRDSGNREALWDALREGIIDAVVSDHSPSTAEEKHRGAPDLQQAWGGISGLQVGFSAVAHEARLRGIGIEQVSSWMAENTAALAGLSRKGIIAPGRDADLVIYDPQETNVVSAMGLAHKNPISAYEHYEITGTVIGAVLRGIELFSPRDTTSALAPVGQFLRGAGHLELSPMTR